MARRFSADHLRQARIAAGLKPEQLAVRIDRSVWTVHSYERGQAAPAAEVLGIIADTLNISIDCLFVEEARNAA